MGIFKKIVEVWGSISLIKRIVIGLAVGIALRSHGRASPPSSF